MEKEPLIKTIFKRIKKRISAKTLIILIVTLSANTFAWFIYANKVGSGIEATVKAWNVTFKLDDGEITEYVTIDVDELYPGKTFSEDITIYNEGDTDADLSYEISSIKVFVVENQFNESQNADVNNLLANIQADYPFTITPSFSSTTLEAKSHETFTVAINWPYESGNDARDTQWGHTAYTYNQAHPSEPSIELELKIIATQKQEIPEVPVTP